MANTPEVLFGIFASCLSQFCVFLFLCHTQMQSWGEKFNDSHNSATALFSLTAEKERANEISRNLMHLNTWVSAEHGKGLCLHLLLIKISRYPFIFHRPQPIGRKFFLLPLVLSCVQIINGAQFQLIPVYKHPRQPSNPADPVLGSGLSHLS